MQHLVISVGTHNFMFTSVSESTVSAPSRTLLLWFAALVVTWVSGIEPTWRKAQDAATRFENVNWQRHEADRKAVVLQQDIEKQRALFRANEPFAAKSEEKREAERAALYKTLLKSQEVAQKFFKASALSNKASTDPAEACRSPLITEATRLPRGTNAKADKAADDLISAVDRLRNFCQLEKASAVLTDDELDRRRDKLKDIIQSGENAHAKALVAAREHAVTVRSTADVSFELLGLKFTAAPLLASLLWSGFACSWLLAIRAEENKPQIAVAAAGDVASQQHRPGIGLVALLALLVWVMQLRVSWVGLGITALQGEMKWRAFVAISLWILLLGGASVVALMLANRAPPEARPAATARTKLTISVGLMSAGVFMLVWLVPGHTLRVAQDMMPVLPMMGVVPLLLAVLLWQWAQPSVSAAAASRRRRLVLAGAAGMAVIGVTGALWWGRRRPTRAQQGASAAARPVTRQKRPRTVSPLEAGFYIKKAVAPDGASAGPTKLPESSDDELIVSKVLRPSSKERMTQGDAGASRTVVHYIAEGGYVARRARRPQPLKDTQPPSYVWLPRATESDLPALPFESQDAEALNDEPGNEATYEVALATASWSFEHEALRMLDKGGTGRKSVLRACELLLEGIRHDVLFKQRNGNQRKRTAPSYRLYDLAAGLAIRFNQPRVMEELESRVKQAGQELLFQSRLIKWADSGSAWHRRWHQRQYPLRWQCDQTTSVF